MVSDRIPRQPVAALVAQALGQLAQAQSAHDEDRPGGVAEALDGLHKALLHLEEIAGCITPQSLFV